MVNFWSSTISFTSGSGVVPVEPPSTLPAPTALSLTEFMQWSVADQIAYIDANGTGTPKSVKIGDPGTVAEPKPTYSMTYTTSPPKLTLSTLATTSVEPDDFVKWSRENQLAYIAVHGVAPTDPAQDPAPVVTLGTGGAKARVLSTGVLEMLAPGVLHTTTDEPIPYYYMSGSANGTPSTIVATSAELLFPTLDGETYKLPVADRPELFDFNPTSATDAQKVEFLKDFAKWHSAYQLEYIKAHQTGTPARLDIAVTAPALRLTAFVSPDDPTKHFIVQSLDKAALARMTKTEQSMVTSMGQAFTDLATSLGLVTVLAPDFGNAQNTTNGGTLTIVTPPPYTAEGYVDQLIYAVNNTIAGNKGSSATLPQDAKDAFIDQLNILKEQIGNSAIISKADIQKKVDELRDRFNRLFAFYNVKEKTDETWYHNNPDDQSQYYEVTVYADVISTDGTLSGVNRGYAVFLAQEKRIAELAEARMKLVRADGILNGKNLDVPYLVYKFQSLYNLSLEAQVVAETEEINQQNDLLKTYAAIQDFINRTLSAFPKADDTKKGVLGLGLTATESLSDSDLKLLSMFEDYLSGSHRKPDGTFVGGQRHPMEILRGITRPTFDFFVNARFGQHRERDNDGIDADGDGHDDDDDTYTKHDYDINEYTHTQWSSYGTRLSETVTIINQNSQIKMNDINSMDKERNRHFELANSALSKMADIIANIARAA